MRLLCTFSKKSLHILKSASIMTDSSLPADLLPQFCRYSSITRTVSQCRLRCLMTYLLSRIVVSSMFACQTERWRRSQTEAGGNCIHSLFSLTDACGKEGWHFPIRLGFVWTDMMEPRGGAGPEPGNFNGDSFQIDFVHMANACHRPLKSFIVLANRAKAVPSGDTGKSALNVKVKTATCVLSWLDNNHTHLETERVIKENILPWNYNLRIKHVI